MAKTCYSRIFSPVFCDCKPQQTIDEKYISNKYKLKNYKINSYCGIFFIIDQCRSSRLATLVDKALGINWINTKYSYSNVIENLSSVFVIGGEVLEDVNFFRQEAFKANPEYRFCSVDTIGRDLCGLEALAGG